MTVRENDANLGGFGRHHPAPGATTERRKKIPFPSPSASMRRERCHNIISCSSSTTHAASGRSRSPGPVAEYAQARGGGGRQAPG